jgi:hypothetical protein
VLGRNSITSEIAIENICKEFIAPQFGAAIEMLDKSLRACPDALWSDGSQPEFWYVAYHALFWLDFYLSESPEGFAPPAPFDLNEMDPAGLMPVRVFTVDELCAYADHCRRKCRTALESFPMERAGEMVHRGNVHLARLELHVYNLRHFQHHVGQLNLMLRQKANIGGVWVDRA